MTYMLFAQGNGLFNLFQMVDRLYLIGRLVPLFTFITGVLSSFFLLLVFNRHHFNYLKNEFGWR